MSKYFVAVGIVAVSSVLNFPRGIETECTGWYKTILKNTAVPVILVPSQTLNTTKVSEYKTKAARRNIVQQYNNSSRVLLIVQHKVV